MSREKKFTPGPWSYDGVLYIRGPNGEMVADFVEDDECSLARIRGTGANLPQEANAHLIAAAPELLEALEEAERFFNNVVNGNDTRTEAANTKSIMGAAISKAYGEEK